MSFFLENKYSLIPFQGHGWLGRRRASDNTAQLHHVQHEPAQLGSPRRPQTLDPPLRQPPLALRPAPLRRHAQDVHVVAPVHRRQPSRQARRARRLRHDGRVPLPRLVPLPLPPPRAAVPRPAALPARLRRPRPVLQARDRREGPVGLVDRCQRAPGLLLRGRASGRRVADAHLRFEEHAQAGRAQAAPGVHVQLSYVTRGF